VLGGRLELLQAGWAKLSRLEEAEDEVTEDDGQTAIHAVVEGDTPTGQVKAGRQRRQGQDVAEQANGVVVDHSTPVGEVDAGVGLGQGD
jgi:hypothetical protein